MVYDGRIRAALSQGIEAGLTGYNLEHYVSQRIGLDQIEAFASINRVADAYKRIVWPVTRRSTYQPVAASLF